MGLSTFSAKLGSTDVTIYPYIQSNATGAAYTGLTFDSIGLVCYYKKGATGVVTPITLATQTVTGAHSDGGFVELSAANMPGVYRLDLPDALFTGTTPHIVSISLNGVANMQDDTIQIEVGRELETAGAVWDEILSGSSHNTVNSAGRRLRSLQEYEGYAGGYIYIDTVNGTAGTTPYENGTVNLPVLSLADALTLSAAVNINQFYCKPGSAITLTQDMPGYVFDGTSWSLAMGGFDLSSSTVRSAFVTGVGTSDTLNAYFDKCLLYGTTIGSSVLTQCGIYSSMTIGEASSYSFIWCYEAPGSVGTPYIDFSSLGARLHFDNWSGTMEFRNMCLTCEAAIYGWGAVTLDATCIGGLLVLAGAISILDQSSGAVDISDSANYVTDSPHYGVAQGSGTGPNQIQLAATASSTDGAYDPSMVYIVDGTGAGQARLILQYDGTTKTATVDRDWKILPDTTSRYRIMPHPGREHVNEGLAQGGTTNTITLNALASSVNNAYVDQIVFIRSGTGEDQTNEVSSYDGTTKIATMVHSWSVIPDTTSGYVMLPHHVHPISEISSSVLDAVVESQGSYTLQQAMSIMLSVLAGERTDATFMTPNGVAVRVTATISGNNRTAMTLNPSS